MSKFVEFLSKSANGWFSWLEKLAVTALLIAGYSQSKLILLKAFLGAVIFVSMVLIYINTLEQFQKAADFWWPNSSSYTPGRKTFTVLRIFSPLLVFALFAVPLATFYFIILGFLGWA